MLRCETRSSERYIAMTSKPPDLIERLYDFITEDDEGRTCEAIPDSACHEAPRNLVLNILNGSATKLAEQMASPGLVLPWLFSSIGAPTALAGLLVVVKQVGSLLRQLAVAGRIRAFPKRKWFWVGQARHPGDATGFDCPCRDAVTGSFGGMDDGRLTRAFQRSEWGRLSCLQRRAC